jgi:hypothetical protein
MRAGGTFTFSVLAHNGGGRPNENDTANVRIQFYTAAGALVSQVNSTYNANLPINNWSQGNPAAQTDVPWSTLTISSSNCGGSCAEVAYAKISMYGVDASYWAGDYGPWYRAPTFQLNGGGNLAYNPEFGPYNNVTAQGWTASPGFGSCQGAWGGSNPCIVNDQGVPGQSTVGLVANANGGGPSATGGTTSGTAGGYNSTMTTTNAGAGTGNAAPTPQPTPIYFNNSTVKITNIWPTSNNSPAGEGAANAFDNNPNTKYLNFDKQNAGVTVKLNAGRVVNGFTITTANDFSGRDPTSYKLYGSNDGVTWVLIQEDALSLSNNRLTTSSMINITNSTAYAYYYIMFPTTKAGTGCGLDCDSMQIGEITYYYDANNTNTSTATGGSSTPVDPVQAASAPQYPSYVTMGSGTPGNVTFGSAAQLDMSQQTKIDTWTNKTITDGNKIYIEQLGGDTNTYNINQDGNKNLINLTNQGSNNSITLRQGVMGSGQNEMKLNLEGNNNVLNLNQATKLIQDGDLIKINGKTGELEILEKSS